MDTIADTRIAEGTGDAATGGLPYHAPRLTAYGSIQDLTKTFPPQTSKNDNTTPYGHVS
jgi:hypothetical protein